MNEKNILLIGDMSCCERLLSQFNTPKTVGMNLYNATTMKAAIEQMKETKMSLVLFDKSWEDLIKADEGETFLKAIDTLNDDSDRHQQDAIQAIAKNIASQILKGEKLDRTEMKHFYALTMHRNPLEGDTKQRLMESLKHLLECLPLYPMKLSRSYVSRLGAEWLMEQADKEYAFIQAVEMIETVYQEIFKPTIDNPLIRSVIEEVLRQSTEVKTVSLIAKTIFVNRSYLSERFKVLTHQSLSNYITQVKMYGAMILFMDDTLVMSDVLDILGYKDEAYFIKNFKTITGYTPNDFIKKFRNANKVQLRANDTL